jgi:hypothetical protein
MNLIGFAATLFLLSLGTYPVVEARIASLPLPAILLGLLLGLLLLNHLAGYRVFLTNHDKRIFAASTFLASWLALVTFASSAAFGYVVDKQQYVGIGYIFAFPFLSLIFRHLKVEWLLWALLAGTVLALSIGYGRFITFSGGVPAEHALGYWGIKYLPSTRNSDVLYPVVSGLVATGLYTITRIRLIKVVLMFIIIASFAAVILSLSRSAWIALSSGYIGLLWFTRHQDITVRRRGKAIGVIVLAGIVVATWLHSNGSYTQYEVIVDRMQSIVDDNDPSASNRNRMDLARDAVAGILRYPAGVGVGNSSFALGRPIHSDAHAENAWLGIGLEGGWLAIIAFSLVLLWLVLPINPIPAGPPTGYDGVFSAIGMALVVAICGYLMFNYELNSLFLWSVLAAVWAIKWRGSIAVNRQDIGTDGGVQCADHSCRGLTLDSRADASGGRNNHCR